MNQSRHEDLTKSIQDQIIDKEKISFRKESANPVK